MTQDDSLRGECTYLQGKHSTHSGVPLSPPPPLTILLGVAFNWGKGETKQRWYLERKKICLI